MNIIEKIALFSRSSEYMELKKYYNKNSMMEIYGITRRENSHSSFLAWLFDPQVNGEIKEKSLELLLTALPMLKTYSSQDITLELNHSLFWKKIISNDFTIEVVSVEKEKVIDSLRRVDIFIRAKIHLDGKEKNINIVIENKINSKESKDQTTDYWAWLSKTFPFDINIGIFLCPMTDFSFRKLGSSVCKEPKFIVFSYQFIVDSIITPLSKLIESEKSISILNDYLRSLTINTLEKSVENENEKLLALSELEKDLLKEFWDKNKEIIMAAIYVQSQSGDIDVDEQEKLTGLYENLASTGKHTNKYQIYYKNKLVSDNVKKTDWAFEITKIAIDNDLFNNKKFEAWKTSTISHFEMLKQESEILDLEKKYRRYRKESLVYGGKEYFVTGNWGHGLLPKLESLVKELFPDIKIKEISS